MAYNTVPYHGKNSRVEKNDVAMDYSEGWQIDVDTDIDDASRQGQDWKEVLIGQSGWKGSFNAHFVAGNTEQKAFIDNLITATPGTKLTDVKFLLDSSTNAFTGDLYIIGFSINPTRAGKVSYSMNFVGNGALSLTDSA